MAKLSELYAEVDGNENTLNRIISEDKVHQVSVTVEYIDSTGVGHSLRRWIFIKNRNLANESAHWDGGKPAYLDEVDGFKADIEDRIADYKEDHEEFGPYQIEELNEASLYAIVKVYWLESGTMTVKHFIFYKSGSVWLEAEIV